MTIHTAAVVRQYLAAVFFIVIGLTAAGCGDSATVNPVVELASLTVSPGTLQPAFSGGNTQYRVDLTSDTPTVTIIAQPAVAGDTVTINGQATTSSAVTLDPPGSTTIVNVVVSETNTNSRTYVIRLVRAGLIGNNSLQNLAVSPGTPPIVFSENTLNYTVDVASSFGSVSVTPTLQDPAATMAVNGEAATSSQARTITLNPAGQNTLITIEVTAQNDTKKSYTILVSRGGLSGNNSLQNLTVSPGALDSPFNANDLSYTVNVANNIGSINITPTLSDRAATMTANGQAATSGVVRPISLNPAGQNTIITITVNAQNGTGKSYTVIVSRGRSNNNNLQSLGISPGTLAPAFSAGRVGYTINVGSGATSLTVTPREQDTASTMTVNGQPTNSGQARTISLNAPGSNTFINIVVVAQDGTSKTYSVNVIRAALGGNNNLSGLTVSQGSLTPAFSEARTSYTVNVGSDVDSITVTPREQDTVATTTVNGQVTTSGQARTIPLNSAGQTTTILIVVTAQNGTPKTYTVNVIRAALGGNDNLSGLTVSPGTLSPAFSAARTRTDYAVNGVSSSATAIRVTATPQDPNATVTINGQGPNSRSIPLPGGPNSTEIDVRVIAPNGNDKTYLITVNQPAPAAPPKPTSAPDLIPEDDSCLPPNPPDPLDPNKCEPGTSREDNFTNKTTPRFRIPQPAGLTPNLYVDGIKVESLFDPANNTLQPTAPLSGDNDGVQHSITSTVTNTATNLESDPSDALIVTISTGQTGV